MLPFSLLLLALDCSLYGVSIRNVELDEMNERLAVDSSFARLA